MNLQLENDYKQLKQQMLALLDKNNSWITNLANASALFNSFLSDINWVGFYIAQGDELYLGPFQGLPACVRIPFGKGVCGTAASTRCTQRIENVHEFPGHIACDSASNSELVIPIIIHQEVFGVLDIDSTSFHRFTEEETKLLEEIVETLQDILTTK